MSGNLGKAVKFSFRIKQSFHSLPKRNCAGKATRTSPPSPPPASSTPAVKDVPGLSKKILNVPSGEVGPGASKKSVYKNPEYYCYNSSSYFEAEVEMMKYRLPQPSSEPDSKK